MGKELLTKFQQVFLNEVKKTKFIKNFYLTGGTALAIFYLNHRYSEDFDFFSTQEILDLLPINIFLKKFKENFKVDQLTFQKSFNRNIFFLKWRDEELKVEFTYFPFEPIGIGLKEDNLTIDSILDIGVNKIFSIYQKPRMRDFIDLYFIIKEERLELKTLIEKAKLKFDWQIDLLNLGTQLIKIKTLKDYPKMKKKIKEKELIDFFINEAEKLKDEIFL